MSARNEELITADLTLKFSRKLYETGQRDTAKKKIQYRVRKIVEGIEKEFGMDQDKSEMELEINEEKIIVPEHFTDAQKILLQIGYPIEVVQELKPEEALRRVYKMLKEYNLVF
ncbi:hypothetical protein [Bacillus halotolerans]|uniref:hypothetical protein n=1 Tax=Bacillus halotolerans TaxID=260554 RepID=UPI00404AA70D